MRYSRSVYGWSLLRRLWGRKYQTIFTIPFPPSNWAELPPDKSFPHKLSNHSSKTSSKAQTNSVTPPTDWCYSACMLNPSICYKWTVNCLQYKIFNYLGLWIWRCSRKCSRVGWNFISKKKEMMKLAYCAGLFRYFYEGIHNCTWSTNGIFFIANDGRCCSNDSNINISKIRVLDYLDDLNQMNFLNLEIKGN